MKPQKNLPPGKKILVLDASCPMGFVGVWFQGTWLATATQEGRALEGLFGQVQACLKAADSSFETIDAYAHDEGPGSVLGIRIAAMAIRTWRALPTGHGKPVFAFQSLAFAVEQVKATHPLCTEFCVISDYRKTAWLFCHSHRSPIRALDKSEVEQLAIPVFHSAQRRAWQSPPIASQPITIDLEAYPQLLATQDLIRPVEQPTVYAPFKTEYKRWKPERHRGDPELRRRSSGGR